MVPRPSRNASTAFRRARRHFKIERRRRLPRTTLAVHHGNDQANHFTPSDAQGHAAARNSGPRETIAPTRPIPSHPVPSHPVPSRPIPSRTIPSRPIPSRPIPSHPIPSRTVPSRPIPSHPIPSRTGPSRPGPAHTCSARTGLAGQLRIYPARDGPAHTSPAADGRKYAQACNPLSPHLAARPPPDNTSRGDSCTADDHADPLDVRNEGNARDRAYTRIIASLRAERSRPASRSESPSAPEVPRGCPAYACSSTSTTPSASALSR